ncbi:MAG: methionine adenosyltransferase [Firmicutes bacterium]|nr:methionine adenosyltransferase [Bacillota bacterium]MDD4335803.1 methionine adenosyltransferase [Bacillota bacterium]MDD4792743.1 methionine adenosyltransferase [Bacillota bacterium]
MREKRLFTSESVTEGHPDKVCDQVADAVLDAILEKDPFARVACEVCATTGLVLVMGEITCHCYVEISEIARETIREIGYTRAKFGFDADTCAVITSIGQQSSDIRLGVDRALEVRSKCGCGASHADECDLVGAGDQGMIFGYASRETPELMPLPITLSHRLAKQVAKIRKTGVVDYLRPDGKTQVTVEYEGDRPVRVDTIIVSAQHDDKVTQETLTSEIIEYVIKPTVPEDLMDDDTRILVNPTGRFEKGGPSADSGLTGRKLIVDTYGGMARHGGGALSGKDPTKVDRSAAYAARHVAKNLVAAGIADRCEVQVAYAIGVARPVSISVDTFGTGVLSDGRVTEIVREVFDLRPEAIIRKFDLRRPIYRQVSAYGHLGRPDLDLPWEALDMVEEVRKRM